jgi:hypothetical protein
MTRSVPDKRTRSLRAVASALLVLGACGAMVGCSSVDQSPVEPVDLEIRQVLVGELISNEWPVTEPDDLERLGIEPTEDVMAGIAWLVAGDCDEPPPDLGELRVACDAEHSYNFLLASDPLTQDDVQSARVTSNFADPNQAYFEFLELTLTEDGAERFKYMTHYAAITPSSEGRVAALLDGVVVSVFGYREAVTDGELSLASPGETRDWEPIAASLNANQS